MKTMLFAFFLLHVCAAGYGTAFGPGSIKQKKKDRYVNARLNAEAGYRYHRSHEWSMGLNVTRYNFLPHNLTETGLYCSYNHLFIERKNVPCIMPGLGFTQIFRKLNGLGYTARVHMAFYDPWGQKDYRFLPEAGLTFLGIINLYYAYAIPVSGRRFANISAHQLGITFNFGYKRSLINIIDTAGGM